MEFDIRHLMTVAELKEVLDKLKPDDVLIPNSVRNLMIERDGEYWGFIDFLFGIPVGKRIEAAGDDTEAL